MAKRSKSYDFDLIVIGSGSGGSIAAHLAARDGRQVALIESGQFGGECLNSACLPTNVLLEAAKSLDAVNGASQFGISTGPSRLDWQKLKAWKNQMIKETGVEAGPAAYRSDGIIVIKGQAHFIDEYTISVNRQRHTARYFLIATGADLVIPPIAGLAETGYLTYRQVANLTRLPKSIVIIGAGATGCEYAYLLNRFGTKVTLVEATPHLLYREDKQAGRFLTDFFQSRGIKVSTGAKATAVAASGNKKTVTLREGIKETQVTADEILLATGKRPNTDLGLENAGVDFTDHGITAKTTMQTSVAHIYAVGDVTGPFNQTHVAIHQAKIAVHNMFKRHRLIVKYHAVPRVLSLDPEVAAVGMTEDQLQRLGIDYRINIVPLSVVSRSQLTGQRAGFVKITVSNEDVLLGALIVAPSAGEMIHELALAINLGLTVHDVASTLHAFPAWSEAIRVACTSI